VVTDTIGGSIAGYSRTGRRKKAAMPSTTMSRLMTVAKTGRLIETSDRTMVFSAWMLWGREELALKA